MKFIITIVTTFSIFACTKGTYNTSQPELNPGPDTLTALSLASYIFIDFDTLTGAIAKISSIAPASQISLERSDTGRYSFSLINGHVGVFQAAIAGRSPTGRLSFQCGFSNFLYTTAAEFPLYVDTARLLYFRLYAKDSTNIELSHREALIFPTTAYKPGSTAILAGKIYIGSCPPGQSLPTVAQLEAWLSGTRFVIESISL